MEDKESSIIELLITTQTVVIDNQTQIIGQVNSLWNKITDSDHFMSKTVKVLSKQRRATQFNVVVSITTLGCVAVMANISIRQSRQIADLNREIFGIRQKLQTMKAECHANDGLEQEGK